MCLILFAHKAHPVYDLVVLANRDEFYARPTRNAHWWEDDPDVLAGKDLKAGGTWLGITRGRQFAALTNYRDPENFRPQAASRGSLVASCLRDGGPVCRFGKDHLEDVSAYNDFNLLMYKDGDLYYFSSLKGEIEEVDAGVHGLSNHMLNTPWPKVLNGRKKLEELLRQETIGADEAFTVLNDRREADDADLPETGVGRELERHLSPMHIAIPGYGTRSSNLVLFRRDGVVEFYEKDHLNGDTRNFLIDAP